MTNKDSANKSTRRGNTTPGQTFQGGGGQLREGAKLPGDDPHFEDRTAKGSASKSGTAPPKTPDQGATKKP